MLAMLAAALLGACPADVDQNSRVDIFDVVAIHRAWGPCEGDCPEDINGDRVVNSVDLGHVSSSWGPCPAGPPLPAVVRISPPLTGELEIAVSSQVPYTLASARGDWRSSAIDSHFLMSHTLASDEFAETFTLLTADLAESYTFDNVADPSLPALYVRVDAAQGESDPALVTVATDEAETNVAAATLAVALEALGEHNFARTASRDASGCVVVCEAGEYEWTRGLREDGRNKPVIPAEYDWLTIRAAADGVGEVAFTRSTPPYPQVKWLKVENVVFRAPSLIEEEEDENGDDDEGDDEDFGDEGDEEENEEDDDDRDLPTTATKPNHGLLINGNTDATLWLQNVTFDGGAPGGDEEAADDDHPGNGRGPKARPRNGNGKDKNDDGAFDGPYMIDTGFKQIFALNVTLRDVPNAFPGTTIPSVFRDITIEGLKQDGFREPGAILGLTLSKSDIGRHSDVIQFAGQFVEHAIIADVVAEDGVVAPFLFARNEPKLKQAHLRRLALVNVHAPNVEQGSQVMNIRVDSLTMRGCTLGLLELRPNKTDDGRPIWTLMQNVHIDETNVIPTLRVKGDIDKEPSNFLKPDRLNGTPTTLR